MFINDLEKALDSVFIKTTIDTMLGRRGNHHRRVEYNTEGKKKKIWDMGRKLPSLKDTQTNMFREETVQNYNTLWEEETQMQWKTLQG